MLKKIEDLSFYELLEVDPRANSQEIHKAYDRIRKIYDPNSIALYSLFSPEETEKIHQRIEEAYRTLTYEENRRVYDKLLRERQEFPEPLPAPRYYPKPAAMHTPPPSQPSPPSQHAQHSPPPPPEEPLRPVPEIASRPAPSPQPVVAEPVRQPPASVTEFTGSVIKVLREQRGLTIRNVADITKVGSRYLEFIEAEKFERLPARPYLRGFLLLYAQTLGYDPERLISDYLKRFDAATGKTR